MTDRHAMPSPRGTNREGLFIGGRVEAAYDAVTDDGPADASALMDETGAPIADSTQAHRILTACIDRLSASDMGKVIDMMKEADLLSDEEVRTLNEGISGGGGEADVTSDAAIMSRRRAQVAAGRLPASALRDPIRREPSEADRRRQAEWFPHADRLR